MCGETQYADITYILTTPFISAHLCRETLYADITYILTTPFISAPLCRETLYPNIITITIYFINPSRKLKLSFDHTTKNISQ